MFIKRYFESLYSGAPHMNEKIPHGPFRYYLDIDMTDETFDQLCDIAEDGHPLKLYRTLAEVMSKIVANLVRGIPVLVFSRRKPGKLHFQFPNVIVDKVTARSFAEMSRDVLRQMYPEFPLWETVFDPGVYNSILRVLGSRKAGSDDLQESVYKPVDLSTGDEIQINPELLELYLSSPHPERDRKAVEEMLESMSSDLRSGSCVKLTRTVAAGIRAIEALYSHLDQLRNQGTFLGYKLAVSKITPMDQADGFFMQINDRHCPFVNRQHRRKSSYL